MLDKQLQDTIYQFDHVQGVVERIDKNSAQLGDALSNGKRIIITTLQKFPFVLGAVGDLSGKNFAIIADEAHSSQTGETASKLKEVLSAPSLEAAEKEEDKEPDTDDLVLEAMRKRGKQANLSFFAFTATPKKRTLEMFGRAGGSDGLPEPYHLYSMRQAIDEGFIHDVLKYYTTYKTYYRLEKAIEDDPELDTKKAKIAIARFVSLHPHQLSQKTEVMVEHFRSFTRKKIGGRAKAMVVTRSRLHAVRYKQAFDKYIADKGYDDMKALVAFSGTVRDEGDDYTEPSMNGFGEKELPDKFNTDDYQVLLVAEKYQTGFDQPLLHTMYVDKKLKGLKAVQTLSRLNRICGGKEDTFVLDFENDIEEIQIGFAPYYERTEIDEPTDPNQLYTLKNKLDEFQYIWEQDVKTFADVFFKTKDTLTPADQGKLHAATDPAVARFKDEPSEERREDFRHHVGSYIRLYSFLSQMVGFADTDLEKLYAYCRFLRGKLPKRDMSDPLGLDDDVELEYFRMDKQFEGDASLDEGDGTVGGTSDVGTGVAKENDKSPLSQIITVINDRFGTDFTEEDRLLFDQVVGDLEKDGTLAEQARNNTMDNFKHAFDEKALNALIARMERNDAVASEMMSNEDLRAMAFGMMMKEVWERARA